MKIKLDKDNTANTFDKSNLNANPEVKGSEEIKQMLRSGIKAAQEGKRSEARNFLLNVTEAEPENEDAWLWLASISEYPEELLIFLNNVLKINPKNEKALEWAKATKSLLSKTFVERGINASKDDQKEFAKQCFLQAIVHDDQNEFAWLWLASISDVTEDKKSYLQRVLRINPENETALASLKKSRIKIAKSLMEDANNEAASGDVEKALESLKKSLIQAPELEEAWILKSHLTTSLSEKLECFQKVLELNPENPIAKAGVASLKAIVGRSTPEKDEVEVKVEKAEEVKEESKKQKPVVKLLDDSEDDLLGVKDVVEEKNAGISLKKDEIKEVVREALNKVNENPQPVAQSEQEETPAEVQPVSPEEEKPVTYEEVIAQQETVAFEYSEVEKQDTPENVVETEPNSQTDSVIDLKQSEPVTAVETSENGSSASEEITSPQKAVEETSVSEFEELKKGFVEEVKEIVEKIDPVSATDEISAEAKADVEMAKCPFCHSENEQSEFVCNSCHAMLTVSDVEMLLAHSGANKNILGQAVQELEDEQKNRELSAEELTNLGLAELNLRNLRKGFEHLQEAVQLNPNNVVLNGQVNSLAIRISEIEQQESIHSTMPKDKTILVVDDSATVRKLITSKLEKCGHEVICAIDGKDALEKINEVIPDLILLDITMPRMDGYQVCKLIRGNEVTREVPVVMISGKDGFFDKVRGRMAGTSGYITKPFGPETLMKTVDSYLG